MSTLRRLLAEQISPVFAWDGERQAFVANSSEVEPGRALEVLFRHDDDVEVDFYLDGVPGSPFEALFVVHDAPLLDVAREIVALANGIVEERVLLACFKGFWRGGCAFLPVDGPGAGGRTPEWTASWLGRYDRNVPASPDGAA